MTQPATPAPRPAGASNPAPAAPAARLRLGLLGCGNHASRAIHPCLVRIEDVQIVAACDLDGARAARTAARYGAHPYTDYQRMLADEPLDAVLVIGPPAMHHELGLAVLRAGKHLIVEKPPANSAAEVRKLAEAAAASNRMGAVSTRWRHSPRQKADVAYLACWRPQPVRSVPLPPCPSAFVGEGNVMCIRWRRLR